MQIKRFETTNLQEATLRIRRELGPDAIILSTKKLSVHPPRIEVLAARDDQSPVTLAEPVPPTASEVADEGLSSILKEISGIKASIEGLRQCSTLFSDHQEFKETMEVLLDHASAGNPRHLHDLYVRLVANGLSRARSFALVETIKKNHPPEALDSLEKGIVIAEKLISRSLRKDQQAGKRIKALIGPTGVGKTTTIAKLAAHYRLDKKMKVGLITTDTYRIAATEQLKVYGRIMDLPVRVASDQNGFLHSLSEFAEEDVILVDTPGRNPRDEQGLGQDKSLFNDQVETLLLMTPTTSPEHMSDTANRLKIFNYDRLILTKLDECRNFGSLYEFLEELCKPVSYFTTGQNVPHDIVNASPERLAQLILYNRLN